MKIALFVIALSLGCFFGTSNAVRPELLEFLFKVYNGGCGRLDLDLFKLFVAQQFKTEYYSDLTIKDEDIETFYKAVDQGNESRISGDQIVAYLNQNKDQSVLANALRIWDSDFCLDQMKLHAIFLQYETKTGVFDLSHFKAMVKTDINKALNKNFTDDQIQKFFQEIGLGQFINAMDIAKHLLQKGTSNPLGLFLRTWKL